MQEINSLQLISGANLAIGVMVHSLTIDNGTECLKIAPITKLELYIHECFLKRKTPILASLPSVNKLIFIVIIVIEQQRQQPKSSQFYRIFYRIESN